MIVKYSRSSILAHVTRPLLELFHAVNRKEVEGSILLVLDSEMPTGVQLAFFWSTTSLLLRRVHTEGLSEIAFSNI